MSTSSYSKLSNMSSAIDSILLRAIKDQYLELSKMNPPPKINPPPPFSILKGSLDTNRPVLQRTYKEEEITISVMRLMNFASNSDDDGDDSINQLFLHVDISKPGFTDSMHFLCALYPEALGIHSVSLRPKTELSRGFCIPSKYYGPNFQDLDEKAKDALHRYLEERGVNESIFPFLQAWVYVKDHRRLMHWFKSVGNFINAPKQS